MESGYNDQDEEHCCLHEVVSMLKALTYNNNCYYWLIQTFITPIICYVLLQIDLPFRNWKRAPLNI